jgi:ABC-type polysaccharide/polyol phosphate export permease
MVTTMGVIYSRLLNMQVSAYLPYLALGLIIWQFILSLFTDGCQTFIAAENIIQQIPVPFSVHAYRVVFRNLLMLAHNAVIIPVGMIIFQMPVGWRMLQMVPALIVLLINGVWISVLCGMMSARFRDVPPIIMSVLSILFFVTPIIWPIDALGDWRLAAELNPAFAAIEVVRAPLLGVTLSSYAWPLLISTTFAGCLITFTIFARFRSRIAYWL